MKFHPSKTCICVELKYNAWDSVENVSCPCMLSNHIPWSERHRAVQWEWGWGKRFNDSTGTNNKTFLLACTEVFFCEGFIFSYLCTIPLYHVINISWGNKVTKGRASTMTRRLKMTRAYSTHLRALSTVTREGCVSSWY